MPLDYEPREAPPPRERLDRKLRTKRGIGLYRQRGQSAELVLGQIKDRQGTARFNMRGTDRSRGEWQLDGAVHNLQATSRLCSPR